MIDLTTAYSLPLSEFQTNSQHYIAQMQEMNEQPIVLTVKGQAQLVVQNAKAYQKLLDRVEYIETVLALQEGTAEVKAGKAVPARDALQKIKNNSKWQLLLFPVY